MPRPNPAPEDHFPVHAHQLVLSDRMPVAIPPTAHNRVGPRFESWRCQTAHAPLLDAAMVASSRAPTQKDLQGAAEGVDAVLACKVVTCRRRVLASWHSLRFPRFSDCLGISMNLDGSDWLRCTGCAALLVFLGGGCSGASEDGPAPVPIEQTIQPLCAAPPLCNPTLQSPVDPTLIVPRSTHAAILDTNFQLAAVLQQLINQTGVAPETPTELYRRLWDTYNSPAGARFTEAFAPHCTSITKGDLPLDCPRTGDSSNAVAGVPSHFFPIALVNRFDLAPTSGANCGEYRIVYWSGGSSNTGTIIFEAQLPNPNPTCGIEACRPVVDFWRSLAGLSETVLGDKLRSFYFTGLPGFRPVIHVQNYGLAISPEPTGGQIRVNTISSGPWQLREMQLGLGPVTGGNRLFFAPVTDKNNPFGGLFNVNSPLSSAGGFQLLFVSTGQVSSLAQNNLNNISMNFGDLKPKYFSFQSTSQNVGAAPDDYLVNLPAGANNAFTQSIVAALPAGSALNADNIVERATTQSCAGCHQISNGRALGGGLIWPSSGADGFGFVHIGPGGGQSQALRCVFLPHRQSVLSGFAQSCGTLPPEIVPSDCPIPTAGSAARSGLTESTSSTLGGGSSVN